jgi:methylthioribose-1-phosphate isomerase
VRKFVDDNAERFFTRLKEVCDYLATSRPTAVNLFWALDRIQRVSHQIAGDHVTASPACHIVRAVQDAMLADCLAMMAEEDRAGRAIGANGLAFLESLGRHDGFEILTHCNAGVLATAGYGLALSPIYYGVEQGRKFHVYADETRPLLQGSRITAYELKENGVPVTIICDNMAAAVMSQKQIDAVIVGADRIAANGDTANKIGTLSLAINAKHFGVPFIVGAPMSTIDFATASGAGIPIEQRAGDEVANFGARPTAPQDADVYNPAFDVTPANLISAIITERGIARAPYAQSLRELADSK